MHWDQGEMRYLQFCLRKSDRMQKNSCICTFAAVAWDSGHAWPARAAAWYCQTILFLGVVLTHIQSVSCASLALRILESG